MLSEMVALTSATQAAFVACGDTTVLPIVTWERKPDLQLPERVFRVYSTGVVLSPLYCYTFECLHS